MWNISSIPITLMLLLLTSCTPLGPAPVPKPSPYRWKKVTSVDPNTLSDAEKEKLKALYKAEKFCNPDYEYGPKETPEVSGDCIPIPDCSAPTIANPYIARCTEVI